MLCSPLMCVHTIRSSFLLVSSIVSWAAWIVTHAALGHATCSAAIPPTAGRQVDATPTPPLNGHAEPAVRSPSVKWHDGTHIHHRSTCHCKESLIAICWSSFVPVHAERGRWWRSSPGQTSFSPYKSKQLRHRNYDFSPSPLVVPTLPMALSLSPSLLAFEYLPLFSLSR